jgi:hypothetical protein
MARIGFLQLLLDDRMSVWEAERINDAHDAADVAQADAAGAQHQVEQLRRRVDAMSREIIMLRTAPTVLTNTLKDTSSSTFACSTRGSKRRWRRPSLRHRRPRRPRFRCRPSWSASSAGSACSRRRRR